MSEEANVESLTSATPGPGGELGPASGSGRMPRNLDELGRMDGGSESGGDDSGEEKTDESRRAFSDLSRRIMRAWGDLWAKSLQVFSGVEANPEREHAELVGESVVAVVRHGDTGMSAGAEARLDLGLSAGLVVVDVLLKRMEQGIKKSREKSGNG